MTVSQPVHHNQAVHNQAASTLVASDLEVKKSKKKAEETSVNKDASSTRLGKKAKLKAVENDIQKPARNIQDESDASNGKGSLFPSGDSHWEVDPLTLFMFENAPVIIELCQRAQDAMTKAQVTETKIQGQNAIYNQKDTIAKGKSQASQQHLKAASEFAQAGCAAAQGAMQASDSMIGDDTFMRDLDAHEQVLTGLNKSTAESEVSAGGRIVSETESTEVDTLSEAETASVINKAKEFKETHAKEYESLIEEQRTKKVNAAKKSGIGLNRTDEWVESENEILANREASRNTYEKVLSPNAEKQEGIDLLKGDHPKNKEAQKIFMKELFNEMPSGYDAEGKPKFENPAKAVESRMEYIGDWGKGTELKQKMLGSYGTTEEGVKMKTEFDTCLNRASRKADMETNLNRRIMDKRQIILQNFMANGMNGLFDMLQKQYIVSASKQEAAASVEASLAQIYGQAKSAQESFVANSIKDMTGIFEWFQSMHGQLLSAQTSAAGV